MSNATLRLLKMTALLAAVGWLALMLHTYLFGAHGLNFYNYARHTLTLGAATLAGFLLVWGALRLVSTPTPSSDPLLIAPPSGPDLSSLESDMLGYLQAYRHWPASPPAANMYDQALRRWAMMRGLPQTPLPHRIAALASVLPTILGHTEIRSPAPWWKLNAPDAISWQAGPPASSDDVLKLIKSLPAFQRVPATDQDLIQQALTDDPTGDLPEKLRFVIHHVG